MRTDAFVSELVDHYGDWEREDLGPARMTREKYPYDALFSPLTINRLTVKNRIVMAPMGNIDMCEETGRPNNKMLQYFFARAKGGTGLLTTGLIPISHGVDHSVTELGQLSYFPRIDRSRTVQSGWRDLAQGVHAYGSRIFVQLTPGLGRVGNPQCLTTQLKFPVSASFNPNYYMSDLPCWRLSDGQLNRIISNAGQAAADAMACGLDGVYLHGHEGYLLEQLTNRAFNRRKLGKYADWQRFGVDLVKQIRSRTGERYPIMYRIDLSLALNETYGEEGMAVKALKKFKDGRSVEETLSYMTALVKAGVDIFDVDLGCYDNWWLPHPPSGMPAGCFLAVSKLVKDYFLANGVKGNSGSEIPVVAVGKLGYPDLAEQALRDGKCDMIMLGRPLLADPEWPNKVYAGRVDELCPCIGCQEGCINEFVDGGHPQCAVDPRTGFEDVTPPQLPKAEKAKRIAVVGAGPAGVNFALFAAERGHELTLFEAEERIGGKLNAGSVPKIKFDLANYLGYLQNRLQTAVDAGQIALKLNCRVTAEQLKAEGYDAVVFATGTKDAIPPISGLAEANAVQATELLLDPSRLGEAKRVVVVGGGSVGCETAYYLAYEKGCEVTVVEMLPYFMDGVCTANRGHLLHYLKLKGVQLLNGAKVTGFAAGEVAIERNTHKNLPDPYNCWQPILPKNVVNPLAKKIGYEPVKETLSADCIVLALGGKADDTLYQRAQALHVSPELYNIGDSFAGGKVLEATRAAYAVASHI